MTSLLNYDASQLMAFIVVLIRTSGIVGTAPIFGHASVPIQLKVVLAFALALILHPFVPSISVFPSQIHHYLILVATELIIGMVLGFVGQFLFAAVELAGSMIGMQMGLSMANVLDPATQRQVPLLGQYEVIFATIIFIAMDAHHAVIQALVKSYEWIPPGGAHLQEPLYDKILDLSANIFSIGFQLGSPIIIALFFANFILGLVNRAVPQFQVFVVGFPLMLLMGLTLLMVGTPFLFEAIYFLFSQFEGQLHELLKLLGPS